MTKLVDGKVALITGAAGGIGREHALMLASHGAKIVVNDLGGDVSGQGEDLTQAQKVKKRWLYFLCGSSRSCLLCSLRTDCFSMYSY